VNINAVNFRNFLYIDFFLVEIMIVFRTTLVVLLLLLLTRSFAFAFANDEANNDDDDDDHEFIIKQVGDRNFVTLEVPPYLFKKKRTLIKMVAKFFFHAMAKVAKLMPMLLSILKKMEKSALVFLIYQKIITVHLLQFNI
jgi:hypothetical protein